MVSKSHALSILKRERRMKDYNVVEGYGTHVLVIRFI